MRKHIFLLGTVAVALFGGCSSLDDDTAYTDNGESGSGDVPIQLSVSNDVTTRSTLSYGDSDLFSADSMGVFCLATAPISITEEYKPKGWTTYNIGAEEDGYSVLMSNVLSRAVIKDSLYTAIEWAKSDTTYFYPRKSLFKYCFAGYYPYVADKSRITYTENSVTVAYEGLNGTQDIIAGYATSDEPTAYSATYFHHNATAELPQLQLNHMMVRLMLTIVKDTTDVNSGNVGIESIKLLQMPTTATLTITPGDSATLSNTAANDDTALKYADYELKEAGGEPLRNDYYATETETSVGQGFFVPLPLDSCTLAVTLKYKDSNNKDQRSITIHKPTGGWKRGYSYNVRLMLSTSNVTTLRANLNRWEQGEDLY